MIVDDPGLALISAWAEVADAVGTDGCPGCGEGLDEDALEAGLLDASDWLNARSGFRYPGVSEATVARPCSGDPGLGIPWVPPGDHPHYLLSLAPTVCGCCASTCCGPVGVTLGRSPIVEVSEVRIDGDVLPTSKWELVGDVLTRTDGVAWPHCQNLALPDTEVGTWSVTFTWGAAPPDLGARAAVDLGCIVAKAACGDASCQPVAAGVARRTAGQVTTEYVGATDDLMLAMPRSVRMFLDAVNPDGYRSGPVMRRPAVRRGCRGC